MVARRKRGGACVAKTTRRMDFTLSCPLLSKLYDIAVSDQSTGQRALKVKRNPLRPLPSVRGEPVVNLYYACSLSQIREKVAARACFPDCALNGVQIS